MKVLSFDSGIEADMNRSCAGREPSDADIRAVRAADAVILPRGCRENLYLMACRNCPNVFPNYDARYGYSGKTGQICLFRENKFSCPETVVFDDSDEFWHLYDKPPLTLPCVFKFSWGGEGKYVFLLENYRDFQKCMGLAEQWQARGLKGFLFQKYIPSGGRSLRAVVMGGHIHTYWRVQSDPCQFYTNLAKGAEIDSDSDPHLQHMAADITREFSRKTGINLAGLDFLFSTEEKDPEPLLLEVNYFFHYTGLGGPEGYYRLLAAAVRDWISQIRQTG